MHRSLQVVTVVSVAVLAWLTVAYRERVAESDARLFLKSVRPELTARYGTISRAQAAGYAQVTPVRWDGTAVYFDRTYRNVDRLHPNFLWYDRRGRLAGIDYQVPIATYPMDPPGRDLFDVSRMRWNIVYAYAHFAYVVHGQTMVAEIEAEGRPKFAAANTALAALHKSGFLPADARLLWYSYRPRCWDLALWLNDNPLGASATFNPKVYF